MTETSKLSKLLSIIDAISEWSGRIFSWCVVPLTLIIVFEVISRSFYAPTIWSFEMSSFLFGAHFMLVAAYGLKNSSHVGIDLIVRMFRERTRNIIAIISYLMLFFPFVLLILVYGIPYAYQSWALREMSWSFWGPPLYPIKTVIPVTALLLLLQGFAEFSRLIISLRKEEHS